MKVAICLEIRTEYRNAVWRPCRVLRRFLIIANSGYLVRHIRPSRRPHGTTRLPLDGFSWNFIFEYFSKIVEKIQVLLKCDKNNGFLTWRPLDIYLPVLWGQDSAVGIATRCCLGWSVDRILVGGEIFPCRPAVAPTQPPVQWVPGYLSAVKAARAWGWPLTPI